MDHPDIIHAELTGYPRGVREPRELFEDSLGNTIFEGDEVIEFDEEIYLIQELSSDAIEILERHGAERRYVAWQKF